MQIFSDLHHSSLYYSFVLTLERRLHHEVFAPIGMEWADKGYWLIHKPYSYALDTARQYLDLDTRYIPKDGTPVLNNVTKITPEHYEIEDVAHGYTRKHLTLEQFMTMPIDAVIASIPDHWQSFKKLCDIHPNHPKLICHMGNIGWEHEGMIREGAVKNLMASVKPFPVAGHHVFYHQEIDTSVFAYEKPTVFNRITSFVIGLPKEDVYLQYRNMLPLFDFRAYGSKYDGFIATIKEMAEIMRSSTFGYHLKPMGDGFGHVLYDWAFTGRPIITNFADYHDKLGGELLEDEVTAIDIGKRSPYQTVKLIQGYSPEIITKMSCAILNRVRLLVDYSKEAKAIDQFLHDLT